MVQLSYATKQMVHTLANNGCSVREIGEALGLSKSTVHRVLQEDIESPYAPNTLGDGCYTTSNRNGILQEIDPVDYGSGLSKGTPGKLTRLESGYPGIYYNEQSKRWEVWSKGKRIWRASSLVKACEVRLAKGHLSKDDEKLLQAVIDSSVEVQEALNYPPI